MKFPWTVLLLSALSPLGMHAQVQASRSYDVYDSVGVNTHWYFGSTYQYQPQFSKLVTAMAGAHLRHFRDGVYAQGTNTPAWLTQMYSTLAANDMHAELIVPQSTTISAATLQAGLQLYPGIEAIEPPNEWDINGGSTWATTLLAEEPAIFQAGHALGLTVLGPALTQSASYSQLGNISQYMDYNNMHPYPGGRNPENGGWGGPDAQGNYWGSLAWNLDQLQNDAPNVQAYATETGYVTTSTPTPNQVPELVAGTYAPRLVLDSFKHGVKRTYFYELVDDPSGAEPGYGLLRYDLSAKPAYTALSNLESILQDSNTQFTPESLNYTLTGNMTGVETMLLEKNNGDFYLGVWLNGSIYDVNALVATPITPQALTLSLPYGLVVADVASFNPDGTVTPSTPNQSVYAVNANSCLTMIHIATPSISVGSSTPVATPAPVFSLAAGTYSAAQTVSLSDVTGGAQIYYTTDGSIPTTSSAVYNGPITVGATETINAMAIAPGYGPSVIASSSYTIQNPASSLINSSSYYVLINQASGKCIDDGNNLSSGAPLTQWQCTAGNKNQEWWFWPPSNNGAYVIGNYSNNNPVWSVTNGATASGSPVQQSTWAQGQYQQWTPVLLASGYYELVDANSKLCLNVPNGAATNGLQLQVATCTGAPSESFVLGAISTSITSGAWYEVMNGMSGMCVTNTASSTSNGAALGQATCGTLLNQEWKFQSTSSGNYAAYNGLASSLVWDNAGGSMTNGNQMQMWSWSSNNNQQWRPSQQSNGMFTFTNLTSGSCLDNAASNVSGTRMTQWTCGTNNTHQQFQLIRVR